MGRCTNTGTNRAVCCFDTVSLGSKDSHIKEFEMNLRLRKPGIHLRRRFEARPRANKATAIKTATSPRIASLDQPGSSVAVLPGSGDVGRLLVHTANDRARTPLNNTEDGIVPVRRCRVRHVISMCDGMPRLLQSCVRKDNGDVVRAGEDNDPEQYC